MCIRDSLLGEERPLALRTRLDDGLVPQREVALRIIHAAEKHLAAPRLPLCLLYTSDAADERSSVDLGGRRIIKKKKKENRD